MVEVIVPFAGDCPHRKKALEFTRKRYPWPVTIAEGGEPWSKGAALRPAIEASTADILVVSDADCWTDGLPAAIEAVEQGAAFAIPLAGLIDIAEEKSRLQKALDKLAKEIGGLKGRLDNPNFVRSAPEDVVIEAQSNLEARQEEAAKVQEALKRLSDLG